MAKYKKSYKNSRRNNGTISSSDNNTYSSKIEAEIEELNQRIQNEAPAKGYAPPLHQSVTFRALPISQATLRGLEQGDTGKNPGDAKDTSNNDDEGQRKRDANINHNKKNFTVMTDIQNACIPHALAGRDILGAARTGSGKTLAFLIPLLECLFRARYSSSMSAGMMYGSGGNCGAIVLSPTRELAVQIFQVLRTIGACHDLSAGLLVGGKKEFALEQSRVGRMNVIVGTPGRVLQHLEQTPGFDVGGLLMLVLDEADRILDMGFRDQMLRILDYLPPGKKDGGDRQTMLFSATQTKKVADLAALSLHKPEYIGVHDKDSVTSKSGPTPESLQQTMIVIPLQHKLDTIFSFIKSHLKKKSIIFFSSCSQVRHVYDLFCTLQPGVPLMALHGKIKQEGRTKVYFDFLQRPYAVLFATDVAARGLDFPNVDWVVQADAPEDKEMYIHRAGRTARYTAGGRALLCVLPSEYEGINKMLKVDGNIPIKKSSINPTKTVVVSKKACGIVASNPSLNLMAKKAFKSYVRSVHFMPKKDIFKVDELPLDEYASSLGLASTPSLRFMKKDINKTRDELRSAKNVNRKLEKLKEQIKQEKLQKKLKKLDATQSAKVLEREAMKKRKHDNSDDEDDGEEVLVKKERPASDESENGDELPTYDINEVAQSRKKKKLRIDGSTAGQNKKIIFDDDGEEIDADIFKSDEGNRNNKDDEDLATANDDYLRRVKERLNETSEQDKKEEKERIREKHKKEKLMEKANGNEDETMDEEEFNVTLATSEASDDEASSSSSSDNNDSGSSGSSGSDSSDDDDSEDESESEADEKLKEQEDIALALIRKN